MTNNIIKLSSILLMLMIISPMVFTSKCPKHTHQKKAHHALKSLAQLEKTLNAIASPLKTASLAQTGVESESDSETDADSKFFWRKKKKESQANTKDVKPGETKKRSTGQVTGYTKKGYHCVTEKQWAFIQSELASLKRYRVNLAKARAQRKRRRRLRK